MSGMEDIPKAVEEGFKCASKTIGALEKAGGVTEKYMGEVFQQLCGILKDEVEFRRTKNKIKLDIELETFLKKMGIENIRNVSPKIWTRMINQALLEDEEVLQNLWINLIKNSLDSKFHVEIRTAFIDILKNLTSLDAEILKYTYNTILTKTKKENIINLDEINLNNYPISIENLFENIQFSRSEITLSLHNLMRVQCMQNYESNDVVTGGMAFKRREDKYYTLTYLGSTLIEACINQR